MKLAILLLAAPLAALAQVPALEPAPPAPAVPAAAPAAALPPTPVAVPEPPPAAPAPPPPAISPPAPAAASAVPAQPAAPSWSIGAGVGFGPVVFGGASALGPFVPTPVASATIERALGRGTWLVLGVAGSTYREESVLEQPGLTRRVQEFAMRQGMLSLGLRSVVSGARAPVELSLLVLAEAGALRGRLEDADDVTEELRSTVWGASAGLAVERELTARLALRLSSPVIGYRRVRTMDEVLAGSKETTDGASLELRLSPSLELRLAF